jgi:rSAM/selenodomain-associated transferase 1
MGKRCILFYVKYPEHGRVKRRLAAYFGEELTTELYKNFVSDSLTTLSSCETPLKVCFYPPHREELCIAWLGTHYDCLPQRGRNLGERMKNSFFDAWCQGYQHVIITGSDIPDLPQAFIKEAFSMLWSNDVVIGPAYDGGYYLIGFRRETFLPEVFEQIPWGTEEVYSKTIDRLKTEELSIGTLPRWHDIDTPDDLKDLCTRNRHTPFHKSKTISFITDHMAGLD